MDDNAVANRIRQDHRSIVHLWIVFCVCDDSGELVESDCSILVIDPSDFSSILLSTVLCTQRFLLDE